MTLYVARSWERVRETLGLQNTETPLPPNPPKSLLVAVEPATLTPDPFEVDLPTSTRYPKGHPGMPLLPLRWETLFDQGTQRTSSFKSSPKIL